MEYTFQLDEVEGVIFVAASGNWELEVDNLMVREIMQTVSQSGCRKIILDLRELCFDLSMSQIFERAKAMRDQRMQQGVVSSKVALIYTAGDPKLDADMKFFETTSQNRAIPYHVFTDMERAREWILQD